MKQPTQSLNSVALRSVFIEQLNILYNAKISLTGCLPQLIDQATFKNLKLALQEDLDDTIRQMISVKTIFNSIAESWLNDSCMGLNAVINKAHQQVFYDKNKHFESDMSVLFYMSVIENLQAGAIQILHQIALKLAYQPYAQLVGECLDVVKENCSLFYYVAEEYLQN